MDIRLLTPEDAPLLEQPADDLFDEAVQPALIREFLKDPRHHLVAAIDQGRVVGFASGVHHVHPDKPAEMFISEVGVAPSHQRRGLARAIVQKLLAHATAVGCRAAWVATEEGNAPARALYAGLGGNEDDDRAVVYVWPLGEG